MPGDVHIERPRLRQLLFLRCGFLQRWLLCGRNRDQKCGGCDNGREEQPCPITTKEHSGLIEIEIAQRLFDGAVFGFLQAFGKFPGENVFFGFFGFDGGAEFRFDGFGLPAQERGRIVQING